MANTNAPFGFRLVRDRTNGGTESFTIASTYATKLGRGDVVELGGSGRDIVRSAAGSAAIIGVLAGIEYTDTAGQRQWSNYWPGNVGYTNAVAVVQPIEAGQHYHVQCDTLAATDIGAAADFTVADATATYGRSQTVLAGSATATTGKSFLIERLAPLPNNAYGAYAIAEGRFVEGANLNNQGGV